MNKSLKILLLSAEAAPFAKVGGLADVAGSLPRSLRQLGHDARLALPKYGRINEAEFGLTKVLDSLPVPAGSDHEQRPELVEGLTYRLAPWSWLAMTAENLATARCPLPESYGDNCSDGRLNFYRRPSQVCNAPEKKLAHFANLWYNMIGLECGCQSAFTKQTCACIPE